MPWLGFFLGWQMSSQQMTVAIVAAKAGKEGAREASGSQKTIRCNRRSATRPMKLGHRSR